MTDANGTGNRPSLGTTGAGSDYGTSYGVSERSSLTDRSGIPDRSAIPNPLGQQRPPLMRRARAQTPPAKTTPSDLSSSNPSPSNPSLEQKREQKGRRSRRPSINSKKSEAKARSAGAKTPPRAPRTRGSVSRGSGSRGVASRIEPTRRARPGSENQRIGSVGNGAGVKSGVVHPEARAGGKLVPLKKSAQKSVKARRRSPQRKLPVPLLYLSRLAIVGLGVAVLGGTLLKALPKSDARTEAEPVAAVQSAEAAAANFPVKLNQEIAPLKAEMQELPNLYPDLTPKAFYVEVDTGNYVDLEGTDAIAAASTIKLPILLAFFEEVDAGRISFEQTLEMLPEQVAEGSGDMQFTEPGTRFTALEVATQMIVTSDNTATNMMIDLLGGPIALNERFTSYGLEKTQLNAPLPDVEGANQTSAKDLVRTMLIISSDRLSLRSRDRILNILNRTHNKDLLANGMVQREALTYNKTGYIGSMLGDIALVDLANGKRYVVAALVERPRNDNRATELIHRISNMTYQASDEAIRPSVTPLGNPDGSVNPDAAGTNSEASANTTEAVDSPEAGRAESSGVEITPIESTP